jgi:glycosyltransferase involved in cell wall biosynthesis
MNILFVTAAYPAREHPARAVFVREHAKAASLHAEVTVLHVVGPSSQREPWRFEREGDSHLTGDISTYRLWTARPVPGTTRLLQTAGVVAAARRFSADVIHANVFDTALMALIAGRLDRRPVILTEHSTLFIRPGLRSRYRLLARATFPYMDAVLPVSENLKRALAQYGVRANYRIVPNAVDTAIFRPESDPAMRADPQRLLFVGLLDGSNRKGLRDLLYALAELRNGDLRWHLDVVGDGPGRPQFESLAYDLGLAECVSFHGFRSKTEIAGMMRASAALVHPAWAETFAVTVAEALCSGLHVIARDTGAIAELISATEGGWLLRTSDPRELREAIRSSLAVAGKTDRHSIAGSAAGIVGTEVVGAQLKDVYDDALRRKGQRGD